MRIRFYNVVFVSVLLGVLLQGCAAYVATSGKVSVRDDRNTITPGFSSRDRQLIEDHFHRQKPAAGRESLPSGFAVRDRLPGNVQGRPLPRSLEGKLTVLPMAYQRLQVGRDVLLMERDTRVVLDLLRGVVAD